MRTIFLLCGFALSAIADEPAKLPHFFKVQPEIYRGAQPNAAEFAALAKMGIGTVISLRSTGAQVEKERRIVEGLGMRFVNIPLRGYQTPSDAHIQSALAELDSARKSNKPAFVHCRLGKDRTGTVIACYRILREGWKPAQALQEARSLGMSVRQRKMQRYVLKYQPPAAD